LGRFFVACDLRSGSRPVFERALTAAGTVLQLSEKLWILRAAGTAGSIRNTLFQHIGARDSLIVIEFVPARTATQNCGPEMDARLRAVLYLEAAVAEMATTA
jgi:hypothetical protein